MNSLSRLRRSPCGLSESMKDGPKLSASCVRYIYIYTYTTERSGEQKVLSPARVCDVCKKLPPRLHVEISRESRSRATRPSAGRASSPVRSSRRREILISPVEPAKTLDRRGRRQIPLTLFALVSMVQSHVRQSRVRAATETCPPLLCVTCSVRDGPSS